VLRLSFFIRSDLTRIATTAADVPLVIKQTWLDVFRIAVLAKVARLAKLDNLLCGHVLAEKNSWLFLRTFALVDVPMLSLHSLWKVKQPLVCALRPWQAFEAISSNTKHNYRSARLASLGPN
jgi:hypothetical protein